MNDLPTNPFLELGPEALGYSAIGHEINNYFATQGVDEWELGSIASRKLVTRLQGENERVKAENNLLTQWCRDFREAVLNGRYQLQDDILNSDQINAVLGLYDDTIGDQISINYPCDHQAISPPPQP